MKNNAADATAVEGLCGAVTVSEAFVYGLRDSMAASRLAFQWKYSDEWFEDAANSLDSVERAYSLASSPMGTGHNNFLCGAVVQMNLTAPRYWWPEFQRYHFADIVTSMSTMHRIKSVVRNSDDMLACFQVGTDRDVVALFKKKASEILESEMDAREQLVAIKRILPEGFMITARITTNYRQFRNMYFDRHDHPLQEWRDFCKWIASLPAADKLILA